VAKKQPSPLERVTIEMGKMLQPLTGAVKAAGEGDDDALPNLLDDMGILDELNEDHVTMIKETLDIVAAWETLQTDILVPVAKGNFPEAEAIVEGAEAVKEIFNSIDDLEDVKVEGFDDPGKLAELFVEYIVQKYLYTYHKQVYASLSLLGVVENQFGRGPTRVNLSVIAEAVSNPQDVPQSVYNWGESGFKSYVVIHYLGVVTNNYYPYAKVVSQDIFALEGDEKNDRNLNNQLVVPADPRLFEGANVDLGVVLAPVPGHDPSGRKPGLAVVPYGSASASETFSLGDNWELTLSASGEVDTMGLLVQPKDGGATVVDFGEFREDHQSDGSLVKKDPPGGTVEGSLELSYTGGSSGEGPMIVGNRDGSGLRLKDVSLKARMQASEDDASFGVEMPSTLALEVDPQGGFIEKLIPKKITTEFELSPGYSTEKGFYFDGSVTLKVPISLDLDVGPIKVIEVYVEIGLDLETGTIEPTVAISAKGNIGPIATQLKRVGVQGALEFPDGGGGNLGFADLVNDFKPPSGAGLSLDTGPISGGGYLEYDLDNERYAGVFDVSIGPVDVKIMGLLTTEMPDGSDGFSMLLSVFGKFPPVQLGFGFTLNGLGGVIGVNRALKAKPLRKATRSGNLDSVLFPEDPVAHAQRIVSDLRSIYPPTRGQHVFGPMARFGWGSPTIITMDLGIVLQLPAAKVAILGKMSVGLPSKALPKQGQMVRLNLAVTGVLDPERQLFSLDAALYDSRVMLFTVKGEMAMRAGWGDNPKFVLSVGGFNPRFKPPSNFPKVKRLTVCLDIPGGTPSVTWKGYFAVTANTVQVGASFDAKFEAGPISAHAWWGLDALFQFNPFKFVVDFEAGVSVSVFGFNLSISFNGTLKGPSPVHVSGKLKVSLPGFLPDPSPQVSITIGESKDKQEQLPVAKVLPKFGDELAKAENWSAQMPADGEGVVSLRSVEPGDDQVLAHPTARLSVRQTLVPIDKRIERFGDNRPKHVAFDFEVDAGSADLPPVDAAKKEEFAPEQYLKMSDSEKMNAPTFERWKAGREVSGDLFTWGCTYQDGNTLVARRNNATAATMTYELKQLDSEIEKRADEAFEQFQQLSAPDGGTTERTEGYPVGAARALADDGAVANADSRWRGPDKFEPSTDADGEDVEHDSNYKPDGPDATDWTLGADGGEGT
jgi:hypothetical protein